MGLNDMLHTLQNITDLQTETFRMQEELRHTRSKLRSAKDVMIRQIVDTGDPMLIDTLSVDVHRLRKALR